MPSMARKKRIRKSIPDSSSHESELINTETDEERYVRGYMEKPETEDEMEWAQISVIQLAENEWSASS